MRKPSMVGLLLVSLLVLHADRVESQGLGDRIKKKAADAAKGKDTKKAEAKNDKKDAGPITSQMGECGRLRPRRSVTSCEDSRRSRRSVAISTACSAGSVRTQQSSPAGTTRS